MCRGRRQRTCPVGRDPCVPPQHTHYSRRGTRAPPYRVRRSYRADRVVRPYKAEQEPCETGRRTPRAFVPLRSTAGRRPLQTVHRTCIPLKSPPGRRGGTPRRLRSWRCHLRTAPSAAPAASPPSVPGGTRGAGCPRRTQPRPLCRPAPSPRPAPARTARRDTGCPPSPTVPSPPRPPPPARPGRFCCRPG